MQPAAPVARHGTYAAICRENEIMRHHGREGGEGDVRIGERWPSKQVMLEVWWKTLEKVRRQQITSSQRCKIRRPNEYVTSRGGPGPGPEPTGGTEGVISTKNPRSPP